MRKDRALAEEEEGEKFQRRGRGSGDLSVMRCTSFFGFLFVVFFVFWGDDGVAAEGEAVFEVCDAVAFSFGVGSGDAVFFLVTLVFRFFFVAGVF